MKVITHQSPLIDNDSIGKNIDGSIRSAHTDTTEEWMATSSSNEEESIPSDYGSVSASMGGSRTQELPSPSKKPYQEDSAIDPRHRVSSTVGGPPCRSQDVNRKLYFDVSSIVRSLSEDEDEVSTSHRCTARRLEQQSADSSGRLPSHECRSQGVNRNLYFNVTTIVKSLSDDEEDVMTSRGCIARKSDDSSGRIPSHECPSQGVSRNLYFDVTAIVKSLSEFEEVKASRRFFSRSKNTNNRSSGMDDHEPMEEESFSSLGSSSFWGDDTSCTSSIDNLSNFLPEESQNQDDNEKDDDFSLSREFQEEDFSFCGSYGSVDHQLSSPNGEGAIASHSICSYQQQQLDDSRNEDVYYDEPNSSPLGNDQQQPQSKAQVYPRSEPSSTSCDENRRKDECYSEAYLKITEEMVQRLDLMVASLEMLISQINNSRHHKDSWCQGTESKRERLVARRTHPLLTLRLSQVRRARRHVMEVLYGEDKGRTTPPDIRRILGMVHVPSQLGRATAVANGQCLSSVQSRS